MKPLLFLAALSGVAMLIAVAVVGSLYLVRDDDGPTPPTPARPYSPPTPRHVSLDDITECVIIAKSRNYDVAPIRILLERANEDGTVTQNEARSLLDFCNRLIGR